MMLASPARRSRADKEDGVRTARLQLPRPRVDGEAEGFQGLDAEDRFRASSGDQRRVAGFATEEPDEYRSDAHAPVAAIGELHPDRARRANDTEAIREIRGQHAVRRARVDENTNSCRALPGKLGLDEDVAHCRHRNKRDSATHLRPRHTPSGPDHVDAVASERVVDGDAWGADAPAEVRRVARGWYGAASQSLLDRHDDCGP